VRGEGERCGVAGVEVVSRSSRVRVSVGSSVWMIKFKLVAELGPSTF